MARSQRITTVSNQTVKRASKPKWEMPQALKKAITSHKNWPGVRASDWQVLAMPYHELDRKLPRSDRRYDLIH